MFLLHRPLWLAMASSPVGAGGAPGPSLGTPVAFTNNLNTTVTDLGSGVYRVTKTSGTDELRNARANAGPIIGDCLITVSAIVQGDAEYLDGFVGLNNAALTTNAPSAIEAAVNAVDSGTGDDANAHAPGGTFLASSGTLGSDKAFIQLIGTTVSFRKGATWETSVEYATTTYAAGSAYCSVLLDTINGYVEVTFQPIEGA